MSCQEHNTMSPVRARTRTARSGDERTNHEATAPPKILTVIWKKDSCPYQLPFLFYVLARLEMPHTPVLGAGIQTNAYLTFSPPPNLHTCSSLVEVYRFGKWLGERFSLISTFFSVESSRAFRNAPNSRFRCEDPNQCLPNFLKMLLLALLQIYTRVFHLWKSIDLDSAKVREACQYKVSFLSQVVVFLEVRHTLVLGAGIPTNAYLNFSRCYCYPSFKSTHVYFTCGSLSI